MKNVIVFDPTISDSRSKVRGVGRYLQLLKENFPVNTIFTDDLRIITDQLTINNQQSAIFINPFFNPVQYPLLMKRVAKKQIAVIHDLIPLKYPDHFPIGLKGKLNVFLNKLALRNYDLIVTDSEASKSDIINIFHVSEKKVKVIYPCLPNIFNLKSQMLNVKSTSQNLQSEKNSIRDLRLRFDISHLTSNIKNFCLYVGDATWNKNLVNIAKAIKIAKTTCVFIGKVFDKSYKLQVTNYKTSKNSWDTELKQFFKEVANDKRFIFPGFVSDNDLIKLYQQARVNLLLSRDEGFGFSPLEAGIFSCPSVVSDIPIIREIIGQDNALFVNPSDPTQIAEAIKKLFSDGHLHQQLGSRAQQRSNFFNQKSFVNKWQELIVK